MLSKNNRKRSHPDNISKEQLIFESLSECTRNYILSKHNGNYNDAIKMAIGIKNDYIDSKIGISKIWGNRSLDSYEIKTQVGEGTYGKVYKAKDLFRDELVALKKIRNDLDNEGFPITAVREIKILRQLCHKNIVQLRDVISDKSDVNEFLKDKGKHLIILYLLK